MSDKVGFMICRQHTADGYQRYDQTKQMKLEAMTLLLARLDLSYQATLPEV